MASMIARGPNVCPGCGERVSAFAAGCALCGADLDPRRGRRPAGAIDSVRRRLAALSGVGSWRVHRRRSGRRR
jgi:hypothetical protein